MSNSVSSVGSSRVFVGESNAEGADSLRLNNHVFLPYSISPIASVHGAPSGMIPLRSWTEEEPRDKSICSLPRKVIVSWP